jgi:hypothetical protein|tara:strand:+ start:1379 stop:2086 length:708 start_codon:yes stop_codon:yes gene_type:complete
MTSFLDNKFSKENRIYFDYIKKIKKSEISKEDFIYQFPVFVGEVNLSRYLFLYECYKKVQKLNGHIADIGTWKGASFFAFAKFVKVFERFSKTHVYGFDWFQGMQPGKNDANHSVGKYGASYEFILKLIKMQNLENLAIIKKMNLEKQFKNFIKDNRWLRFKLVFIDCGIEKVLVSTVRNIWPRIVNNGILILDHYNDAGSPSESDVLDSVVGRNVIQQMPFVRQPTAFVIKKHK